MKALFLFGLFLSTFIHTLAQDTYFPPNDGVWDTISTEEFNWCEDRLLDLHEFLNANNSRAFIILKNGKIAVEWYFNTFNQDSLWYWASAGKTVTAALAGIAQEEGMLDIMDYTSEYLGKGWTNCPEADSSIRIWHQLTMTNGLDDGSGDPHCTLDTCLNCLVHPGERWAYHNAPYTLLRDVIENASGLSYNVYYYTRLANKIGMGGGWFQSGYNNLLITKPRDAARFGLMILNGGIWNGDTIIKDRQYFNDMITRSQELNESYGYLWWLNGQGSYMLPGLQFVFNGNLIPSAPADLFAGLGKNDQKVYVVPSSDMVVIRMGEAAGGDVPALSSFDDMLWEKITNLECEPTNVSWKERSSGNKTVVYPNPVDDILRIHTTREITAVSITDMQGLNVLTGEDRMLDVSSLEAGMYLAVIYFSDGDYSVRKFKKW